MASAQFIRLLAEKAKQTLLLPLTLIGYGAQVGVLGPVMAARSKMRALFDIDGTEEVETAQALLGALLPTGFIPSPDHHLMNLAKWEKQYGQGGYQETPLFTAFIAASLDRIQEPHVHAQALHRALPGAGDAIDALYTEQARNAGNALLFLLGHFNDFTSEEISFFLSKKLAEYTRELKAKQAEQIERLGDDPDPALIEQIKKSHAEQLDILTTAYNRRIQAALIMRNYQVGTKRFEGFQSPQILAQFKKGDEVGAHLGESFDVTLTAALKTGQGKILEKNQTGAFVLKDLGLNSETQIKTFMRDLIHAAIMVAEKDYVQYVIDCQRATPPKQPESFEQMLKLDIKVSDIKLARDAFEAVDHFSQELNFNIQLNSIGDTHKDDHVFTREHVAAQTGPLPEKTPKQPDPTIMDRTSFRDLKVHLKEEDQEAAHVSRPGSSTNGS